MKMAAERPKELDANERLRLRLRQVTEERDRWEAKHRERLARKERLKKLLDLEVASEENGRVGIEKAGSTEENEAAKGEELAPKKKGSQGEDASVAARKKQLLQLQERVRAAEEKQQAAASTLARNLKQLGAATNSVARAKSSVLPAKRKHSNDASTQSGKKFAGVDARIAPVVGVLQGTAEKMHEFSGAVSLDVGSAELQEAACLRIATRHLVETGKTISRQQLELTFEGYTGQVLNEGAGHRALALSLERLGIDGGPNHPGMNTRWQPGRQYLSTPTFSSSKAHRIQALVEMEKQTITDVCDPLGSSEQRHSSNRILRDLRLRAQFLLGLLGDAAFTPESVSVASILAAFTGASTFETSARSEGQVCYQPHRQLSSVFVDMVSWLRERALKDDQPSRAARKVSGIIRGTYSTSSSTMTTKPFSLEDDSVVKQLRAVSSVNAGPTPTRKKLDPMKMLCHYELNGVCNDTNCPYQHQKDFDSPTNEDADIRNSPVAVEADSIAPESKALHQVLMAFAEFRAKIRAKWPLITSDTPSTTAPDCEDAATKTADVSMASGDKDTATSAEASETSESVGGDANIESSDFLVLEEVASCGSSPFGEEGGTSMRYYAQTQSAAAYVKALQKRVEENPGDTDAWLVLAINQLGIDVGASDESVNITENSRLCKQLVSISQALNVKLHKGPSSGLMVEETNLKRCLHTLSRALEVEANAYSEAIWLLYLHLCRQLTTRQTEVDMAEKAVQFLPTSHALWLRYLSTYEFDSITMAEEVHWRILQYLVRPSSEGEEASLVPEKAVSAEESRLLTAIVLHLCTKLQRAGAWPRAIEFLSALVKLDEPSTEWDWCSAVRARLRAGEMVRLSLVIAHLLIFHDIPVCVEHWVGASSCEDFALKELAYTVESAKRNWPHGRVGVDKDTERALQIYEHTFQLHQSGCSVFRDVGDVLLNNWMVVLAQRRSDGSNSTLKTFLADKSPLIQQYPAASLSAASITGLQLNDAPQACQLMVAMLNQSPATQFPEAFHYFLFACRKVEGLVEILDKEFPDVMVRLASGLGMEIEKVKSFLQKIKLDTDLMAKSTALKALLKDMLSSWMNQLAMQGREIGQDQTTKEFAHTLVDIFVVLDICQLMESLVGPSAAVDSIRMVLSASKFSALPLAARQLVWSLRFDFEVALIQHEDPSGLAFGEHRAELMQLLRKYMDRMSVGAELTRQVTQRITQEVGGQQIQEAVCLCLYPERRQLVSFDALLEIFQLCCAAVPRPEKAAFFASFTDILALAPEFSLAFCETAVHEWEWRAARASLKRCLAGSKSLIGPHPEVLRALIALELRQHSMKAVSSILESELQADPLLLETWRLVVAMEIIFGGSPAERSEKLAADFVKRGLVFTCNTFGDAALFFKDASALGAEAGLTTLSLRGVELCNVPNAVLLQDDLVSLDLSGNLLVDLPSGLERLKKLTTLNISENSLLELPACISRLPALKELKLAHNNLTAVPIPVLSQLPKLEMVDLRSNAVTSLPASILGGLQSLKVLHAEGNSIPPSDLDDIAQKLSNTGSARVSRSAMELTAVLEDTTIAPSSTECAQSSSNQASSALHPKDSTGPENGSPSVPARTEGFAASNNVDVIASEGKENDSDEIVKPGNIIDLADNTPELSNRALAANGRGERNREVIDVDGGTSDMADEAGGIVENTVPTDGSPPTNTEEDQGAASSNGTGTMMSSSPPYSAITVADARRDHAEAAAKAAERQHANLKACNVASRELKAYMESAQINSRAEVREQNPRLWRKFVAANLSLKAKLGDCVMCLAPNDGRNQRFNGAVLCVQCLGDALRVVVAQESSLEETKKNS